MSDWPLTKIIQIGLSHKNTMFSFDNFRQLKNSLGLKLVSIWNNVVFLYADMHFKYESQVRKLHLQSELIILILFFSLFGPADSRLLAISAVLSCLGQQYILGFTNIDVENWTSGLPLPPPPPFLPQTINISSFASLAWLVSKTCILLYTVLIWELGIQFNATSNSIKAPGRAISCWSFS